MDGTFDELGDLDPKVKAYIESLQNDITALDAKNHQWESRYEQLAEEYRLLIYKRFVRSSEKGETDELQASLFEEAETNATAEVPQAADEVTVKSHKRTKVGRKPLDEKLPRIEILHDISDEEKRCACGHELTRIRDEVSERLQVIPEQIYVERHVRPLYACKNCEGSGDEERPAVRVAPAPPSIIPGSIVTSGLLAFILVNKFCDHLPFYRQEQRFERIGVGISRQDMSNWTIGAYRKLGPLLELMRQEILKGPLIQMDETPLQVLNESERADTTKSYMWLARGGPPRSPLVLYTYRTTRSGKQAREFLGDYHGYLQTDGYAEYDRAIEDRTDVIHVGCWAHARRKFFEASKASKTAGAAHEGLKYIQELYRIESELRAQSLADEQFAERRRALAQPNLEKLHAWLEKKALTMVPSSLTGKAVHYTLGQWEKLIRYLEAPYLKPDTNDAENAIRPFVLGRKNWLFAGSPAGADASCAIYSLIETAKQNDLDPYAYLHYVFERVPSAETEEHWRELLPQNIGSKKLQEFILAAVR